MEDLLEVEDYRADRNMGWGLARGSEKKSAGKGIGG
jgi:hypothetical protein